jgi:hypothetical protein
MAAEQLKSSEAELDMMSGSAFFQAAGALYRQCAQSGLRALQGRRGCYNAPCAAPRCRFDIEGSWHGPAERGQMVPTL